MLGSTHETGERSLQTGRPKGRPKNLGSNGAKLIAAASADATTAEIARSVAINASRTPAAASGCSCCGCPLAQLVALEKFKIAA